MKIRLIKYLSITVILTIILSCNKPIGGQCLYDKQIGTAKIIDKKNNLYITDFYPQQEPWAEWNIKKNHYNIDIDCSYCKIGKKYPAIYKILTKGTCSPIKLELYQPDELTFFIERNTLCMDNMKIDEYSKLEITNILEKFYLLKQMKPDIQLGYKLNINKKYLNKQFETLMLKKFNFNNLVKYYDNKQNFCNSKLNIQFKIIINGK